MEFILSKLGLVGPFFLLLGILIFIHEWGHFIVARICGVRVEVFSIGFGPKILKKKWGDTEYRLSIIPLGGYVKMYGDGTEDFIPEEQKAESFNDQSLLERASIVLAGPMMNLIFAFFLFGVLNFFGQPELGTLVGEVEPSSIAYQNGLREGDKIVAVGNQPVSYYKDLSQEIAKYQDGAIINLSVERNGEQKNIEVAIAVEKARSPISLAKKEGSLKGVSPVRTSSLVGVAYDSDLAAKGTPSLARVVMVNDKKVESLYELKQAIGSADASKNLSFEIEKNKGEHIKTFVEPIEGGYSFESLGFVLPELVVGQVRRGSPAEKAGLKNGDQIISINGQKITEWLQIVEAIKATPKGESVSMEIGQSGEKKAIVVQPEGTEIITATGQVDYRPTIGVAPALEYLPPKTITKKSQGIIGALKDGAQDCYNWTYITLRGFKKLITGEVSHKTLSGVISIGKVAHDSLSVGWAYFINMMGIISINLFILNLLPVPILDGGHLLFYFCEFVKGSPVSLRTRLIGHQIGLVLILTLVVYTVFNDVTRIFLSGW